MNRLGMSVRTRLAVLYGAAFLLAGVILLMINWLLMLQNLPDGATYARKLEGKYIAGTTTSPDVVMPPAPTPNEKDMVITSIGNYRSSAIQSMVVVSGIALLITGALAVLLGWAMAGRILRPLHAMTATARRLEAGNLNRRINLDGPPGELKELADTFDGMLDRLASAFDSQRRFVANASHELRTPLAVQRTLVEVAMADPEASPDLQRLGKQLLLTNERSERLIEGLLVLARSDRGLTGSGAVRLDAVVDLVRRSMADLAAQHDVTVHALTQPRVVVGDQVLLERLVTNLVHNAIHYNEPGGSVRIVVGEQPALVIENTGPPVPGELVPGLFEPFRRLVGERTANARGAGLGLSIVRSIATAHGGGASAEPRSGGGLRVSVVLPGQLALPPAAHPVAELTPAGH